jgi:hypothetical protein
MTHRHQPPPATTSHHQAAHTAHTRHATRRETSTKERGRWDMHTSGGTGRRQGTGEGAPARAPTGGRGAPIPPPSHRHRCRPAIWVAAAAAAAWTSVCPTAPPLDERWDLREEEEKERGGAWRVARGCTWAWDEVRDPSGWPSDGAWQPTPATVGGQHGPGPCPLRRTTTTGRRQGPRPERAGRPLGPPSGSPPAPTLPHPPRPWRVWYCVCVCVCVSHGCRRVVSSMAKW